MAKHDLTKSLEKEFTFSIDGKEFSFRKPTVREMRQLSKLYAKIESTKDVEEQTRLNEEANTEMYKFVTPLGHGEYIGDVIESQPVSVQVAFYNMVQEELGAK